MYNDIIIPNVKLIDEKVIINERKIETIKETKTLVYYVAREFEPIICDRCSSVVHKVKDYRDE